MTGLRKSEAWSDAAWVAALLALAPRQFGGVHIIGPSGPERDAFMDILKGFSGESTPFYRCPVHVDDERLFGGLDLSASLTTGTSVLQQGLLSQADGGFIIFSMAECLPTRLGAHVAQVMDTREIASLHDAKDAFIKADFGLILLDEGDGVEERAPDALSERCAFALRTDQLRVLLETADEPTLMSLQHVLETLSDDDLYGEDIVSALVEVADQLGIDSFRPILAATHAARAIAAISRRTSPNLDDVALAVRLTLTHRATRLPAPADNDQSEPSQNSDQPENHGESATQADQSSDMPDQSPAKDVNTSELLVETVKAALPSTVLAQLQSGAIGKKMRNRDGRGNGDSYQSPKRGRPIGSRRGSLRSGMRLHLIDTLRAAAPWQKIRQGQSGGAMIQGRVLVRKDDVRIRRFVEKRETTIIFAVDASGSTAWQRLAEAKGAVQLMLAHAYQSRARVALVAFRKDKAELVLPPTRSLARARRLLSDMVGGGGTPLAHGLETALTLALSERAKGRTPRLLILTDGRGNIARDGSANRQQAEFDALAIAQNICSSGIKAIHIDTSPRPRPGSHALAAKMGGLYAPLPSPRSGEMARLAGL